jgi:hypothetical protein
LACMMTDQKKKILSMLLDGPVASAEVKRAFGISPATLSRLVKSLGERVVTLGKARATQYARPRDVRGIGDRFPVYQIAEDGRFSTYGTLQAIWGGHFWWESVSAMPSRLFRHLPWFVQDMRPEGFVGRAYVHRIFSELNLPGRLSDWNDDDTLVALSRRGDYCMGNLIIGDESLERYIRGTRLPLTPVTPDDYPGLAQRAMDGDPVGSSAGGEQPKFSAIIERGGKPLQVLVKFSPRMTLPDGRRWADLLVCEHIALETVREAGFPAVKSSIHQAQDRTFLEVERFDRCDRLGRLPMHSLGAVDDEFFGRRDNWVAMAGRLANSGMISSGDAEALRWVSVFGSMIANTDQHFGNISLIPLGEQRDKFSVAPVYDMLPMLYRPKDGEETYPEFVPPVPSSGTLSSFDTAQKHSILFWEKAASDSRISEGFRSVCEKNRGVMAKLSDEITIK